jgi:aldehyde:ferredoxin oxidoreductase
MSEDKEYDDLLKAEKKAKREKKQNMYHLTCPPCCLTCDHSSQMSIEDDLECSELYQERWAVNSVAGLGLCDKYLASSKIQGGKG